LAASRQVLGGSRNSLTFLSGRRKLLASIAGLGQKPYIVAACSVGGTRVQSFTIKKKEKKKVRFPLVLG